MPFYFEELHDYEMGNPGGYCSTPNIDPDTGIVSWNMAATSASFYRDVVTLCIENFGKQEIASTLADLEAVDREGINLDDRRCHSLNLFHEAIHLMGGTDDTPDHAC